MGSYTQPAEMKFLIAVCALVVSVSSKPRYLVIPLEDVEFGPGTQQLPVYRMPALARQAREIQDSNDDYQVAPSPRSYPQDTVEAASNAYSSPAAASHDDAVDMGAYTGGGGAFGWYTDHPVLLSGH